MPPIRQSAQESKLTNISRLSSGDSGTGTFDRNQSIYEQAASSMERSGLTHTRQRPPLIVSSDGHLLYGDNHRKAISKRRQAAWMHVSAGADWCASDIQQASPKSLQGTAKSTANTATTERTPSHHNTNCLSQAMVSPAIRRHCRCRSRHRCHCHHCHPTASWHAEHPTATTVELKNA